MAIALPILLVLLLSIWQLSVVYGTWRTLHERGLATAPAPALPRATDATRPPPARPPGQRPVTSL